MSFDTDTLVITNSSSIATATIGTIVAYPASKYERLGIIIGSSATASVDVSIVGVIGDASAAIPMVNETLGNTASAITAETAQTYCLNSVCYDQIKIKASSTATIAANAITVSIFGITN